jgi:broad specificity phosphatase PhoE
MEKTIVYLVRHGEVINPLDLVYSSVRDIFLSPLGLQQMEDVAKKIQKRGDTPSKIICSPFARTVQSSGIISHFLGDIPIEQSDLLKETETHNLVGRPLPFLKALPDPYSVQTAEKYQYRIESLISQGERVNLAITNALGEERGNCVIILGHGHPLSSGYYYFTHPGERSYSVVDMKKYWYFQQAAVLRLEVAGDNQITNKEVIGNPLLVNRQN